MISLDTQNAIVIKAKQKKDGCYRFRGAAYRVRDGRVTHIGGHGEIFSCFGQFNVKVKDYNLTLNSDEVAQKILKTIKG